MLPRLLPPHIYSYDPPLTHPIAIAHDADTARPSAQSSFNHYPLREAFNMSSIMRHASHSSSATSNTTASPKTWLSSFKKRQSRDENVSTDKIYEVGLSLPFASIYANKYRSRNTPIKSSALQSLYPTSSQSDQMETCHPQTPSSARPTIWNICISARTSDEYERLPQDPILRKSIKYGRSIRS